MNLPQWITLVLFLLCMSAIGWAILFLLGLAGKLAKRIMEGTWGTLTQLIGWIIVSMLLALLSSFGGVWVTEVPIPPPEADNVTVKAYVAAVFKEAIKLHIYVIVMMFIVVAWTYLVLIFGLIFGKYPAPSDRSS